MPTSRTRRAVVAFAVCGTVVTTAASSVVTASAATPPTIAAVTFTAPPGTSLDNPQGVVAANGTIDVSNTNDNVVASIVCTATTTIAGSYEATGESGDGGPATAATLDQPTALARDKPGDFTGAFLPTPNPAPSIPAATAASTAAELAFQTQHSTLPLPAFPGQLQSPPSQQPGRRHTVG